MVKTSMASTGYIPEGFTVFVQVAVYYYDYKLGKRCDSLEVGCSGSGL